MTFDDLATFEKTWKDEELEPLFDPLKEESTTNCALEVLPGGLGFRVQSSEFRVQGSGFRVHGGVACPLVHLEAVEAVENVVQPPHHLHTEREIFIDNLLVRVHLIIEMILVDRPCAMGVWIPFSR